MNGMAIFKRTDEGAQAVFVDQDVLECAKLNMRTKERMNDHRKEKAEKEKYMKELNHIADRAVLDAVGGAICAWAGSAELMHPMLWVTFTAICMGASCLRLGQWFGKVKK